MKNYKFYLRPILLILISIIIYWSLFFLLITFTSSNESIISFVRKINRFIQPVPTFLLFEDVIKVTLPSIYLLNSFFCGLIVFISNKFSVKNNYEMFIKTRYYLIRISILMIFIFFINYIKSFSDNRKIISKYHEVR